MSMAGMQQTCAVCARSLSPDIEHVKFQQFIDTMPRMVCVCPEHSIYVHHESEEHYGKSNSSHSEDGGELRQGLGR